MYYFYGLKRGQVICPLCSPLLKGLLLAVLLYVRQHLKVFLQYW